jgi:hypothetical protein
MWQDLLRLERRCLDFLTLHHDADEIVVDVASGLPVKAVYGSFGKREEPTEYWFNVFLDQWS